jgi:2-polyprenyl-6-methoxyphenol hydroxylase-like FAD-dependent oxidoreductase
MVSWLNSMYQNLSCRALIPSNPRSSAHRRPMQCDRLTAVAQTDIWALFDHHILARTVHNGNTALIGDAAHATTPYQGLGAGFAIEDAYVLASLFAHVQRSESSDDIESCLKAYNNVRIDRGHRLVETSRSWRVLEHERP